MRLCKPQRSLPPSTDFNCEAWNSFQVIEWLKGTDDDIPNAKLNIFSELCIDGKRLLNLDIDDLKRMGIDREVTRSNIISAINLLIHYTHTVKYENLQKLAVLLSLSINELLNELLHSSSITNNLDVSNMVNRIFKIVDDVWESVARLIFWLERNPFAANAKFAKLRNELSNCINGIVECASNLNDAAPISIEQKFIEESKAVRDICKQIVFINDPSVLYTAFFDRASIRRTSCTNWGFEVGKTSSGLNLITWVDYNSSAVLSDKFDIGDEIIELSGVPVVGWKYSKLMDRLSAFTSSSKYPSLHGTNSELYLLLCKRPRDPEMLKDSSLRASRILLHNKQLSPRKKRKNVDENGGDDQLKTSTGGSPARILHQFVDVNNAALSTSFGGRLALRRIRSSSFTVGASSIHQSNTKKCESGDCSFVSQQKKSNCVSLFIPSMDKKPIFRQSSVWNSPIQSSVHSKKNEKTEQKLELNVNANIKTSPIREIPESDVSIFVAEETSERSNSETEPFELCELALSDIELVHDSDLELLNIVVDIPSFDTEWNAPVREITGLSGRKRVHLDNGGVPLIDSPLSNIHAKIARFFHGDSSSPTGTTPPASLPPPIEVVLSANKFVRSETQECKTPITPNSKISLELPLSAKTTGEEGGSSFCSIDSPFACSMSVITCSTVSRRHRLAPLAEPDEIGDMSCTYSSPLVVQQVRVPINLAECANISCEEQHQYDFAGWIRVVSTKPSTIRQKSWMECWAIIKDGLLYIYENEKSDRADVVVNLAFCSIGKNLSSKAAKKHTFVLKTDDKTKIQFAAYSEKQLRSWMDHIIPQVAKIRSDKSSDSSSLAFTDTSAIFSQKGSSIVSPSSPQHSSSSQPFDSMRNLFSRVSLRGSVFKSKHSKE